MKKLKRNFRIRLIFKLIAFAFLILGVFGISWGDYLVPVQKSAASVAFVFDISNSMLAKDCEGGKTRLEASSLFAKKLLMQMAKTENTAVSVILAKGEGVTVVPQTEDYEIIYSLLEVLSPNLVSAPGTSLAKGIIAAKNSFSANFATANKVWVFTDGEETDGQLSDAMEECIKTGTVLSIIGFGSETETDILAGDKKTKVKSALRTANIIEAIETTEKKFPYIDFTNQQKLLFVKAEEKGSALRLLAQIKPAGFVTFESRQVPRFRLFLIIAAVFYVLSFVLSEFDTSIFKKSNIMMIFTICLVCVCFTGCDQSSAEEKRTIFNGVNAFHHKKYNQAISYFLQANDKAKKKDDVQLMSYSLFNLGTCYIMQNEDEAAVQRFSQVSEDAPANIRYAAYYNSGIVAYRNQNVEMAAQFFRKALEVDSSKIEAKANLELCVNKIEVDARQYESKISQVNESKSEYDDEESSIFEHIKENDKNQWKNSQVENDQNLAEDY